MLHKENNKEEKMRKKTKNIEKSGEIDFEEVEIERAFLTSESIQEKLKWFSKMKDSDAQMQYLEFIPENERYKFIGKIKSILYMADALDGLPDDETKRKTFNFIAKQFKGRGTDLLHLMSLIKFKAKLPDKLLLIQLNNLNNITEHDMLKVRNNIDNFDKIKFKINEEDDSRYIEYSFSEMMEILFEIKDLVRDIDRSMPEADKFFKIYSRSTSWISYDHLCVLKTMMIKKCGGNDEKMKEVRRNPAGLYGGLVNGKAICVGHALIDKIALNYIGIKCKCIGGDEFSGDGHAWNQVQIDGKWYNFDPTWDAEILQINGKYKYMLLNDADFAKSHGRFCLGRTKTEQKCKSRFDYSKIKNLLPSQIEGLERSERSNE